jgi:hypothetical protein
MAPERPQASAQPCLYRPRALHLEGPAGTRVARPRLDEEDALEILRRLRGADSAGRLRSEHTGEWLYVFLPRVAGETLYVKLLLRDDCLIVSFHEQVDDDQEAGP